MADEDMLAEAFQFAAEAHRGQVRKGTSIPYVSHVMQVSGLVLEFGGDQVQAIAGLLHDTLEDGGPHLEEPMRERFPAEVADIVIQCTDGVPDETGRKPPWRERKESYITHLRHAPDRAILVSGCDKLHNARCIAADVAAGHDVYARFSAPRDQTLWYYDSLVEVFVERLGPTHPLIRELANAVAGMKAPGAGPMLARDGGHRAASVLLPVAERFGDALR